MVGVCMQRVLESNFKKVSKSGFLMFNKRQNKSFYKHVAIKELYLFVALVFEKFQ